MERTAPLLVGQKRDLSRVLESHAHLTTRLHEVGAENKLLRYRLSHDITFLPFYPSSYTHKHSRLAHSLTLTLTHTLTYTLTHTLIH